MANIAIVYWSGTGNTEAMANLVAEGVRAAGAEADIFAVSDFSAVQAKEYGSIAFGCPAMGAEVLEETEFEPLYLLVKPELAGKNIALFGSYDWGDGEWMRNWAEDCAATGCNIIGEPLAVHEMPEGSDADACKALGEALAKA